MSLLEFLNGSTNLAALVFLVGLWRHDRRLIRLELHNFGTGVERRGKRAA